MGMAKGNCAKCTKFGVLYRASLEDGMVLLCQSCFQKWRFSEGAESPRNGGRPRTQYECRVCGKPAHAKGLCQACYKREKRGTL